MKFQKRFCRALLVTFSLVGLGACGCSDSRIGRNEGTPSDQTSQKLVSRRGILTFKEPRAKTMDAWHGHDFFVDEYPVLPTKTVSYEDLKRHVGKRVIVKGREFDGTPYDPPNALNQGQGPAASGSDDGSIVMRGWGLQVHELRILGP